MRTYLLIILSCCLFSQRAQADNHYLFQKVTMSTPYTELTGDTSVPLLGTISNSGYEYNFEFAGDTFSFFNKNFYIDDTSTMVMFSTSGHIGIPTDTSFLIFDGMFTYLDSIDQTSDISYKVEGTGNNKVIKIQWKNLRLRAGPAGNFVNFQMYLYKATGVVEVRYGPSSVNNQSGYNNSTGPNVGMFYSNATFTTMYEKIWLNGLPSNYTIDSNHTVVFNAMHGVPSEGTMYRFVPKSVAASVSEKVNSATTFSIYPNPVNDELVITLNKFQDKATQIELFDIQGRLVTTDVIKEGENNKILRMEKLPAGRYNIRLRSGGLVEAYPVEVKH